MKLNSYKKEQNPVSKENCFSVYGQKTLLERISGLESR